MIRWKGSDIEAIRNPGDPRARDESRLYYMIKEWLDQQGQDVIKKRPDKDGHLTSAPYYIRKRDRSGCWIDRDYMLRDLSEDYNHGTPVTLTWNDLGGRKS